MPMIGEVIAVDVEGRQFAITVVDLLGKGGEGVVVACSADKDFRDAMGLREMGVADDRPFAVKLGARVADEIQRIPRGPPPPRHVAAMRTAGIAVSGGDRWECAVGPVYRRGSVAQEIASTGGLPVDQAADFTACMLAALRPMHAKDVVHSDVKPGNLLVIDSDRCVLADFGGSHAVGTSTDRCLTVGFASASVLRGMPTEPKDDVHAAGISLAQMLRGDTDLILMSRTIVGGKSRWNGNDTYALDILADHQPTMIRTGHVDTDQIVARMIAPDRHNQFDAVDALAAIFPFTSQAGRDRTVEHEPILCLEDIVAIGQRVLDRLDERGDRYDPAAAPLFRRCAAHLAREPRLSDGAREIFERAAHAAPPVAEHQAMAAQAWIASAQQETALRVQSAIDLRDRSRPSRQVELHRQAPPEAIPAAKPRDVWWERRT